MYYKQLNEAGEVALLLHYETNVNITNPSYVEITEEEYKAIAAEIAAKNQEENNEDELSETEQKAAAYDILTGVSE